MIFTSIDFVIFFVVIFSLYWSLQKRLSAQNLLILAGSYFFYGYWDVRFLYLIVISTAIDYLCGQMIQSGEVAENSAKKAFSFLIGSTVLFLIVPNSLEDGSSMLGWQVLAASIVVMLGIWYLCPTLKKIDEMKRKKLFVGISVISNLTILGFFKYFNFFTESFAAASESIFGVAPNSVILDIILPVGISFYTFQTMSYSIDIYRGQVKATRKFVDFAAYVSFFPQLVAGPIERAKHLLPQFHQSRNFPSRSQLQEGIWLIAWGFFKKLVIADNVAVIANTVFAPYDSGNFGDGSVEGLTLMVGVYAFAIQIYCDFSGYTDIARGISKLFGFDLMLNFNLPYFAADPSSFWRRWHISLSSWLRDYLYIPLGGNRSGSLGTYRNLSLTMLLGGLWHGAAWTFVIWGAFHGLMLSVYRALGIDTEAPGYPKWKRILMTLLFFQLTCVGWLIFRAQNTETIGLFLYYIFTNPVGSAITIEHIKSLLFFSWFLIVFQLVQVAMKDLNPMKSLHWFIQLNIWIFIVMSLLVLSAAGGQEFIYFAF